MVIYTLARKELRLLLRDRISALLLFGMPLLFILLLGLLLGEGFGQKPDDSLRVSVVNLDEGLALPMPEEVLNAAGGGVAAQSWEANAMPDPHGFPGKKGDRYYWSKLVQDDLSGTSRLRVEIIEDEAEARRLVKEGKRPAVIILGKDYSKRMHECSFLENGINPFHRDGVRLDAVDVEVVADDNQPIGSSVIGQVVQVSLMRVILPYMIGAAFDKLSSPDFLTLLLKMVPGSEFMPASMRKALAPGIQAAIAKLFPKYNLRGKTWGSLTSPVQAKPKPDDPSKPAVETITYQNQGGVGPISRGALRYQTLVPAYTVMFSFGLILTLGWLFVLERRQGTMPRLRTAPISRTQILLGKMVPCYLISFVQGMFLLIAGKLLFAMRWGPDDWPLWKQLMWLTPIVATTSLAAMGIAMFVATLARTEIQVALIGSMLVLFLGLISGCLVPGEMMPEAMQEVSRFTPHHWALVAYRQLLRPPESGPWTPDVAMIGQACGILTAYGLGFTAVAWGLLRLD